MNNKPLLKVREAAIQLQKGKIVQANHVSKNKYKIDNKLRVWEKRSNSGWMRYGSLVAFERMEGDREFIVMGERKKKRK